MSKNKETSNVQKSPKKSNAPIVAVGVAVLCGVALLTYTATTTFVNKLNENADADYRVAYDRLMSVRFRLLNYPLKKPLRLIQMVIHLLQAIHPMTL